MREAFGLSVMRMRLLVTLMAAGLLSTTSCNQMPAESCPEEVASAAFDVSGTFRYRSAIPFDLTGTITFEQSGQTVRVTGTTYDFGDDRDLVGEGTLVGNRLDIVLVPKNGDTDYRADVTFLFSEDGGRFCVSYSDTNGDAGDMGSFAGTRSK